MSAPSFQLSKGLDRWMSLLSPELRSCPLSRLAIPGSHDSMMYKMMRHSPISPEATPFLKMLLDVYPSCVKHWVITQSCDAAQQMLNGIRYFDIRVCLHKGRFMLCHGVFSGESDQPLRDINEFLRAHPSEVVILDFQHVYLCEEADHERYCEELKTIFGEKIYGRELNPDLNHCTLDNMAEMQKQVIIIYRDYYDSEGMFWTASDFLTPWPNTTNIKRLEEFLEQGVVDRPKDKGYVTQCVLTPDGTFIAEHLLSNIKSACAVPVLHSLADWIITRASGPDVWPGHNIFIADFVDLNYFQFVRAVLSLNKIIEQSLNPKLSKDPLGMWIDPVLNADDDYDVQESRCCKKVAGIFCCKS